MQRAFQLAAQRSAALEDYRLLMQEPDDSLDLLRGATLIARHRHPLLRHEEVVEQLDDLAVQIEGRMPGAAYPLRMLQTISGHLRDRGFKGNSEDYYDPDNSCINMVLERRTGIPITLSLVYMEVAKRLGLPMVGVNIPGHFFITPANPDMEFLVDAFDGGEISFLQDAEATLSSIYKRPVQLDPSFLSRKQPVPPRVFLARMLNNLKQIYNLRRNYADAYAISCYMRATRPGDLDELRDSGVFLYQLGRYPECVETLTEFLARVPADSEDAEKVRALLRSLDQRS